MRVNKVDKNEMNVNNSLGQATKGDAPARTRWGIGNDWL
jgi:hypothetical protein